MQTIEARLADAMMKHDQGNPTHEVVIWWNDEDSDQVFLAADTDAGTTLYVYAAQCNCGVRWALPSTHWDEGPFVVDHQ